MYSTLFLSTAEAPMETFGNYWINVNHLNINQIKYKPNLFTTARALRSY